MLSILWEIKCKGLKNLNISESPSFDFFSVKSWPVSHSVGNKTKDESQNGGKKKLYSNTNTYLTLLPPNTCAYQGVRNVHFFGKLGVLCFLVTSILRSVLLSY